jgi:hypothetical protein
MRLSPESSRVLADLVTVTGRVREERKVWCLALTAVASRFRAGSGALVLYKRSRGTLYKVCSFGNVARWRAETLLDFFHNRKPGLEATAVMAPVRTGNRVVGVLALGRDEPFERGVGKEITEMLKTLGVWTGLRRDLARRQAECVTARAAIRGVSPKDLAYRIFHQLRRFIDYNHGATMLRMTAPKTALVLARQVAWAKGRSDLVGREFALRWEDVPAGGKAVILSAEAGLFAALGRVREAGSPEKQSILMNALVDGGRVSGLVEISSASPDFFFDGDTAMVDSHTPYLAWCAARFPAGEGGHSG